MLRDSDGDIGGGKFTRSGSYALSSYFLPLGPLYLLRSYPILFDLFERRTLGRCANEGTAKRNLRAPREILFGSPSVITTHPGLSVLELSVGGDV